MPFRKKAKSLFKTKSREDSSTSTSSTNHSVYKPGEPMPPPKYRRTPQKEHKDKLEAFSFADAWRKRSFQSARSPMGTRASSRRTSMVSNHNRKSVVSGIGRKSMTNARASEDAGAGAEVGENNRNAKAKDSAGGGGVAAAAVAPKLAPEAAEDNKGDNDDDDVANVAPALSQSKDKGTTSRPKTAESKKLNAAPNGLYKTMSTAHDHQPFSEQDIAKAMERGGQTPVAAQS